MKFLLRSLLLSLFLLPAAIFASTTAPMFAGSPGTTLTIHGETYTWTSATEDGTWHNDTYTNGTGHTLTVKGLMYQNWAMVSGPDEETTISGHMLSGEYGDNVQAFTGDGSWVISGVTFTHRDMEMEFSMKNDLNGYPYLSIIGHDNYSGADGTLSRSYEDRSWTGVFAGGKVPFSGRSPTEDIVVFGATYHFVSSSSVVNEYTNDSTFSWTDSYSSPLDGGTLQFKYTDAYGGDPYSLSVWDSHLGTVTSNTLSTVPNGSLTGITWRARSAPTFAKAQLWLDGKLLNWQSGAITTAGLVTDTYSGAGVTLTVSALAHDYFVDGGNAALTITSTGGGSGTLAHEGTFNLNGHMLQNASPNHSAPLFTGSATVLSVLGGNYAFVGGFQDSLGNRTDFYENPSSGFMTISGVITDPNHASVRYTRYGFVYSGTYNSPYFSIFPPVSKPSSQPSIYGPPAFWVRGELYLQNSTTPTSYASAASHSLTLSGSSTWTLAGADATGAFSGTCSHDPLGVFLVQALDESSQPIAGAFVPVIPANADGSLHLSWEAAPTGMPPGVRENNHNLVYLGTTTDDADPASTAAYYGSATASDQTPWLLKIRTDGSTTTPYTATYTDYSTATSTTGSYSTQTHLFQTSAPAVPPAVGFPVPVYGVDPTANFALWALTQPQAGLPDTFMVRGQPWRLAAYDASTDTATYQGFYTGQQMALGAADSGERLVTLTDPVYNQGSQATTQGTLNNERRSALLRDGTLVLSGTDDGQQAVVQHTDDYKLQTIAADLDIVGNNLSFGILNGDASRAGALFNFGDDSATASLHSILSRPLAQWAWWKAEGVDSDSLRQVMRLDSGHRLNLYQAGDYATPAIVLDPAGTSSFRGPVRVPQSGDIPMGIYQEGDPP
ncbi:MAG: hypothetical protein ACYC67_01290 [Prosthecobacter sp.]